MEAEGAMMIAVSCHWSDAALEIESLNSQVFSGGYGRGAGGGGSSGGYGGYDDRGKFHITKYENFHDFFLTFDRCLV